MTYREDFTLPAELLEQVQEQGLDVLPELIRSSSMPQCRQNVSNTSTPNFITYRSTKRLCQRLQVQDDANPCRRYHLLDSASAGRRFYPQALEKACGVSEPDVSLGRNVCPRSLDSQGQGHHRAVMWHFRFIGDGKPGGGPDG